MFNSKIKLVEKEILIQLFKIGTDFIVDNYF